MMMDHDIKPPQMFRIFDWDKARTIIEEKKPSYASAGLREDWNFTGDTIYKDGQYVADHSAYLYSYWATPILVLSGDEELECWKETTREEVEKIRKEAATI